MNIKAHGYWIIFAVVQNAGFVALSFANHSNIAPFFTGTALLLPGGILLLLDLHVDFALLALFIVTLNFVVAGAVRKWGDSEWR